MNQVPRRHLPLLAALLIFSTAAVVYAAILCFRVPLARAELPFTVEFLVVAVVLEHLCLETSQLGYISLGLPAYAALWTVAGPQWAIIGAAVALLSATITRSNQDNHNKVADVCMRLLAVAAAATVYSALVPEGSPGLVGLVASILIYFGAEYLLSWICSHLVDADRRSDWLGMRMRARVYTATMIPVGFAAGMLGTHLNAVGETVSLAMPLVLVLPLIAFYRSLRWALHDNILPAKENLEDVMSNLREELLDYKSQNRALMADLHKRVDEIAILRDMGQQLGASKDLDKTLEIIISMIRKLLIYQSCVIYLVDLKGALVPAKCVSPYKDVVELSPLLQLEESMVNLVVQSRKPVLVSDMQGDSEHRIFNDEKSIMCVPLIVKDQIIGVIYVGTLRPGTYNDDHVHVLETLANPAAIAIKSAQFHELQEERLIREMQLKEQVQERVNQLNVLYHLGTDLNRCVKLADITDIIAEKLGQLVPFQSCIIFVMRPQDGLLTACKVSSPYEGLFTGFTQSPDEEGILGWVATNKRHILLSDTRESRFANLIERERSFILVPLLTEDEVIGEIYVGAAQSGVYDDEILGLVTMVAAQAAMAIQKALLFERTEGLAITDGVTGLYTHRYFQERLSEEVRWADRYGRPLSLIMVDTDHFKKFNDTLGHPEGDKLLKEISSLLRSYTRESDLVCRYGGDEFSLILKDTDKDSAVKTGERIRDAFQLRFGKLPVKVTASIGVSSFPSDAHNKAELVAAADAALYRSKQGGRNRVSSALPLDATQIAPH